MPSKKKQSTEAAVREIRRRTRRKFAPEEKVRIVLEGLRGEQTKHVVQVPEVYRSPAGKTDFKRTRQTAMDRLGIAD